MSSPDMPFWLVWAPYVFMAAGMLATLVAFVAELFKTGSGR